MTPFTAIRRDGKIVLEIDEREFMALALGESTDHLTVVDRERFLQFVTRHMFTLSHDFDESGAHPSWWRRLAEALATAAAASNQGVRASAVTVSTCGCDPEEHDGG